MKKTGSLILLLFVSLVIHAQEIDPKVEEEYNTAYNSVPQNTKSNIKIDKSETQNVGVLFLLDFRIDTLNKDKYVKPKPVKEVNTFKIDGREVGIMDAGSPPLKNNYDYLFTFIGAVKDSFMFYSYTPNDLVTNRFYDKGEAFFSFTLKFAAGKLLNSSFEEESADSSVKRYRSLPSSANLEKITLPLKVEQCYFSASPLTSKNVYGKAVLTTGAFYAANKHFNGKLIYKRYRMTVVFQSPVNTVKK